MRNSIAKNTLVLMLTQRVTWGLTLLLTIFMPRHLGAAAIGRLTFATSVWAILAMIATFGMDTLIVKTVARSPEQLVRLFWNSIILRGILFFVVLAGLTGFLTLFGYPAETRQAVMIMGFNSLLWLMIGAVQAALQGLERMDASSPGNIAGKLVSTLPSILLLLAGYGLTPVMLMIVLSSAVNLVIQLAMLNRLAPLTLSSPVRQPLQGSLRSSLQGSLRSAELLSLLRRSLPFLFSGLFLVAYMEVDKIVISVLVNEQVVGWYGAASQLFGTLLFIPTALMTAVFPALARQADLRSEPSFARTSRKSFAWLLILTIPIGLGVTVIADPVVQLLFGSEFTASGAILAVLGLVLILTSLNIFLGQTLISLDQQNRWTVVMGLATAATLPLDFWLVPLCVQRFANGGIAGALSFLITEAGMVLAGLLLLPRGLLDRGSAWIALRAAAAGLLMAGAAWQVRTQALWEPILLGAAVYLLAAWALKLVTWNELSTFLGKSLAAVTHRSFHKEESPAIAPPFNSSPLQSSLQSQDLRPVASPSCPEGPAVSQPSEEVRG